MIPPNDRHETLAMCTL